MATEPQLNQSLYGFGDKIFGIAINTDSATRGLSEIARRQFPFACSYAINKTLQIAKSFVRGQMDTIFDRPTPFTLGSLYTRNSSKQNLYGELGFRYYASKGTPASRYLYPSVYGGERKHKASETILANKGLIPRGSFLVMARSAPKNQYGNISAGAYERMLSAVGAQRDVGYVSNSRRGGRGGNRNRYFIGTPRGGNRPRAIYERVGGTLRPMWYIISHAHYRARFPIVHMVEAQVRHNYDMIFTNAMAKAINTPKPT